MEVYREQSSNWTRDGDLEITPLGPAAIEWLVRYGVPRQSLDRWPEEDTFEPLPPWILGKDEMWDWLQRYISSDSVPVCLQEMERDLVSKVGPQGGRVSFAKGLAGLKRYYNIPCVKGNAFLDMALRYWLEEIRAVKSRPVEQNRRSWATAAMFPYGGVKSDPKNVQLISDAVRHYGPLLPAVAGYRHQRNKARNIFMDSVYNCLIVEPILSSVRFWLRSTFPEFASWRNPMEVVNPAIMRGLQIGCTFFEGDYAAMDTTFSYEAVRRYVLPVYKAVLERDDYLVLEDYVWNAFRQPVIIGTTLLTGTHATFSGEPITNDFETIMTIIILTAIEFCLATPSELRLALGDDSLHAFKSMNHDEWKGAFHQMAHDVGLNVELSKLRVSREPRYLRRQYWLRGITRRGIYVGAYPATLWFNSVFNPEYPEPHRAVDLVSQLQRCDNLVGHPGWSSISSRFFTRHYRLPERWISAARRVDWWEKVYDEPYNPGESPTYLMLGKTGYKDYDVMAAGLGVITA